MADDCDKKAAELSFDLTKQFITLALAGIAFIVGLSFNSPGAIPSALFWATVLVFAFSTVLGLLFLMRGVNLLSVDKSYDVYAVSLRILSGLQIILVLIGVGLLVPTLSRRAPPIPPAAGTMEIRLDSGRSVTYPITTGERVIVEVEGSKVTISPTP